LLEELKAVDALLFTTNAADLPANFTFAVMAETRSLPAPKMRQHPIGSFVALYVTAAWVAALAGILLSGVSLARISAGIAAGFDRFGHAMNAGLSGIGHWG
jgi:hypothetical protein